MSDRRNTVTLKISPAELVEFCKQHNLRVDEDYRYVNRWISSYWFRDPKIAMLAKLAYGKPTPEWTVIAREVIPKN